MQGKEIDFLKTGFRWHMNCGLRKHLKQLPYFLLFNYPSKMNTYKKLSEKKREIFYDYIMDHALSVSIGIMSEKVIDEVNIYEATKLVMYEAINSSKVIPEHILIDAMKLENLKVPSPLIIEVSSKYFNNFPFFTIIIVGACKS